MQQVNFSLPHIQLAGFSNGQVGKPPLLALHGWLDNAGSFEMMLPYWNDYHVIAIDLPGHGFSAHRSADAHYHFVDWVYDISELIDDLNWPTLTLVGHSMGGMIGSVVAAVLPQRIKQLVLIDSFGLITTPAQDACKQLRNAINSRKKITDKNKVAHPNIESATKARVMVSDLSDKEAQVLLKRGVIQTPNGFVWRSDSRLRTASAMRFCDAQAMSFFAQIDCPVLLIQGDHGAKMVEQHRQHYQQYFSDLKYLKMPGGHHCHMEHPQMAAELINDFLQGRQLP